MLELMHPDDIQHNPVFKRSGEENGAKGRTEFELRIRCTAAGEVRAGPVDPAPPVRILVRHGTLMTENAEPSLRVSMRFDAPASVTTR